MFIQQKQNQYVATYSVTVKPYSESSDVTKQISAPDLAHARRQAIAFMEDIPTKDTVTISLKSVCELLDRSES